MMVVNLDFGVIIVAVATLVTATGQVLNNRAVRKERAAAETVRENNLLHDQNRVLIRHVRRQDGEMENGGLTPLEHPPEMSANYVFDLLASDKPTPRQART